jgi:hypothetical protein
MRLLKITMRESFNHEWDIFLGDAQSEMHLTVKSTEPFAAVYCERLAVLVPHSHVVREPFVVEQPTVFVTPDANDMKD